MGLRGGNLCAAEEGNAKGLSSLAASKPFPERARAEPGAGTA